MIILAAETSTLLGSVCVLKDNKIIASQQSLRQNSHSEVLNIFIEKALTEAKISLQDIDLFASGIGPGSFTGIRISLNSIKTFSYCFNKPCLGLNSLQNLAQPFLEIAIENRPIISMINAYKNMVYFAKYKKENDQLISIQEPIVVRVQNLNSYMTEKSYVVGDGFLAYKNYIESQLSEKIIRSEFTHDEPSAISLSKWAHLNHSSLSQNWNELTPIYLRESEAEENAKGIKYQPLF